jgi:hypothetical protein
VESLALRVLCAHIAPESGAAEHPFSWSSAGMSDQEEGVPITERIKTLRLMVRTPRLHPVFGATHDEVDAWLNEAERLRARGDDMGAELMLVKVMRSIENPRP